MSIQQGGNILLSVWGDDFRYAELEEWYQQYDNLILLFDYINTNSKRTKIKLDVFISFYYHISLESISFYSKFG